MGPKRETAGLQEAAYRNARRWNGLDFHLRGFACGAIAPLPSTSMRRVFMLKTSPGDITLHPRIGSLALRLCRVAQGSLDAAFAGGQSRDWDLAAANLIVQEADGKMTALSGDAILYNRREVGHGVLVAAGRDRHASIVSHFRSYPLP